VSSKEEGPAKWVGPVGQVVVRCGDWQIRAEQSRTHIGAPDKWDVFCAHKSGERVPAGSNMHAEPAAELERLERLLDWPRKGPYGFSWLEDRPAVLPASLPWSIESVRQHRKRARHLDCDCSGCLPATY
jgi:hypothetical protein